MGSILVERFFEDVIDGYFPIGESLKQMLQRFHASSAWVNFIYAPIIRGDHLAPSDPVPVNVAGCVSGMINDVSIFISMENRNVALTGVGDWHWHNATTNESEPLASSHRLVEPVFVRGYLFSDKREEKSIPRNYNETERNGLQLSTEKSKTCKKGMEIKLHLESQFGLIQRGKKIIKNDTILLKADKKIEDAKESELMLRLKTTDDDGSRLIYHAISRGL